MRQILPSVDCNKYINTSSNTHLHTGMEDSISVFTLWAHTCSKPALACLAQMQLWRPIQAVSSTVLQSSSVMMNNLCWCSYTGAPSALTPLKLACICLSRLSSHCCSRRFWCQAQSRVLSGLPASFSSHWASSLACFNNLNPSVHIVLGMYELSPLQIGKNRQLQGCLLRLEAGELIKFRAESTSPSDDWAALSICYYMEGSMRVHTMRNMRLGTNPPSLQLRPTRLPLPWAPKTPCSVLEVWI